MKRIVSLEASDFEEAMDFLDQVFGERRPHDFRVMLPALYQPTSEHMGHNLALRAGGRIVALTGVFPITWRVGRRTLRIAGIGGVSVAPEWRERGLMRRLLAAVETRLAEGEYDLSFLAGDHALYQRFGWEKAGSEIRLLYPWSPRARVDGREQRITRRKLELTELDTDGPTLDALQVLHDAQPLRCCRRRQDLGSFLRHWHHRAYVARDEAGAPLGYLVDDPVGGLVPELVSADDQVARTMAWQWVALQRAERTFVLPALPSPLVRRLVPDAETLSVGDTGNWRILRWQTTLGALLQARHETQRLPAGRVVLDVHGHGRLAMAIDAEETDCTTVRSVPDLALDAGTATRVLFGPLPPDCVVELPPKAGLLRAWCPLPLGIPVQDRC